MMNRRQALADQAQGQVEELDATPIELPLSLRPPPTMREMMQQIIRQEMSFAAQAAGSETFEEANDFDIDDEDDVLPFSIHEDETRQMIEEIEEKLDGNPDTPKPPGEPEEPEDAPEPEPDGDPPPPDG
jgi:hypothetical protein